MKFVLLLFLLGLTLAQPFLSLWAENLSSLDSLIYIGLDLTYRNRYEEALRIFQKIVELKPENPIGYLLQASVLEIKMMDFERNIFEKEFHILLNNAIEKCKKILTSDPQNPWGHFFLGTVYSYQTAYQARRGKYWSAFLHSLKAIGELKKTLSLDPTLYDVYLGLGSYHYFVTKATRFLSWLPFIGDQREKGIAEIHLAMERGKYTKTLAKDALVWILMEEGRYEEALKLAGELLEEYPDSRTFHWAPAEIYFRKKEWKEAETAYRKLLSLMELTDLENPNLIIFVRNKIARTYLVRGLYLDCFRECQKTIALPLEEETRKRLAKRLRETSALLHQCEKKIANE